MAVRVAVKSLMHSRDLSPFTASVVKQAVF